MNILGQLLISRKDTSIVHEAQWLVARPPDAFTVVEGYHEPPEARAGGGTTERALYHEGAMLFRAGKDQAQACDKFIALLSLPPTERRHFSTMAAFMLGRCDRDAGDFGDAHRRFAQVRQLARQGFDDPLGLAVASYGEQGHIYLYHDDPLNLYDTTISLDPRIARYQHNHPLAAIRAYARQASFGSSSGVASLLFIARRLVESAALRERVIRDPLGQRLLTTYLWTRGEHEVSPKRLLRLYQRLARIKDLGGATMSPDGTRTSQRLRVDAQSSSPYHRRHHLGDRCPYGKDVVTRRLFALVFFLVTTQLPAAALAASPALPIKGLQQEIGELKRADTYGAAKEELRQAETWLKRAAELEKKDESRLAELQRQRAGALLILARQLVLLKQLSAELSRLEQALSSTRETIVTTKKQLEERSLFLEAMREIRE